MEGLGIDLQWFLFQLGNFIVLLFGLNYLLHKPLTSLLESRKQEIQESLENAARIREELASTEEQKKELLEKTRKESAAILKETQERGKALEEKLSTEARAKADQVADAAKQDFANEREQLRRELKGELATLVVETTRKVLGEKSLSEEKQRDLKSKIDSIKA